ncbi:hypothetical protein JL720_16298 [Aureococcus anophagefferens]|nr:hypothetical protein JL720_16298 [Aureococcus anophagefferens]
MVYVRSAPSIAYLPKLTLLYFLAAHGTFYALARPYALLNLAVAALLMAHAVLVILEFELGAARDVDHETPRARHTAALAGSRRDAAADVDDDDNAAELVDASGGDADAAAPIFAPSPASSSASSG